MSCKTCLTKARWYLPELVEAWKHRKKILTKSLEHFGFQSQQSSTKHLELATTAAVEGARPFSMFDDSSMREMVNYALLGGKEAGTITGQRVRDNVIERAKIQRGLMTTLFDRFGYYLGPSNRSHIRKTSHSSTLSLTSYVQDSILA
jgi:hypothetical protein